MGTSETLFSQLHEVLKMKNFHPKFLRTKRVQIFKDGSTFADVKVEQEYY